MKKEIRKPRKRISVPKECYFCKEKKEPDFWDSQTLQRFLSERSKIVPMSRSGICTAHQRALNHSIKHARLLALLPFVAQI